MLSSTNHLVNLECYFVVVGNIKQTNARLVFHQFSMEMQNFHFESLSCISLLSKSFIITLFAKLKRIIILERWLFLKSLFIVFVYFLFVVYAKKE